MADFCSKFEKQYYDIDLARMALELDRVRSKNFLFESCHKRCLFKDEDGILYIGILPNNEILLTPIKIEDI